mmetsp:Transcript_22680/g.50793  ORF Transcript_22680/g.50793 Transcript_22680/m.50793 type:complete len:208 (+) Transcript_22680:986-1609(+)
MSTRRLLACLKTRRRSSRMISRRLTQSVRRSLWSTLTEASLTSMSQATSSSTTPCPRPSAPGVRCGTPMTRRRISWPPYRTVATPESSASASTSARRMVLSTPRPWGRAQMSASWLRRPRSTAPTRPLSRPRVMARCASLKTARTSCSWGTGSPRATSGAHARSRTFPSRIGSSWPSSVAVRTTSRTTTSLARRSSGWTRRAPMMSS